MEKVILFAVLVIISLEASPLSQRNEFGVIHGELEAVKEELNRLEVMRPQKNIDHLNMPVPPRVNILNQRIKPRNKTRLNKPPEQESVGMFESDLVLSPEELLELQQTESKGRVKRKAVKNDMKLWPNKIIPYQFDNSLPLATKNKIAEAIRHWEDKTCLRFRRYTPGSSSTDRIIFTNGQQCQSPVGRRGGPQEVMIGGSCATSMGSISHEIGHSAGFYHEHSRPDRDDHVDVLFENINPGFVNDFRKQSVRSVSDLEPYDISSVMHYGPTWMSKDGSAQTLAPKDKKMINSMGQRDGLSFLDVKTANELYKCSEGCPTNIKCKNEGFIGANCACVCPFGLSGRDCSEVLQGSTDCGGVLTSPTGKLTSPNFPGEYDPNSECYWFIMGPPGSKISLTFDYMQVEEDDVCSWDYVEVRQHGPHLGGSRYCGESEGFHNLPTGTIEYPGNNLLIKLKSDDGYQFSGFSAAYQIHN